MSDLALQLIAQNKNTKSPFLGLGNCGLTEIQAEIGELVWLDSVSLASGWYEWDGKDWQEKKSLNVGDKNDRVTDLTPLSGLTSLRSLIVANTQITDLAPLSRLINLQTLNIRGTPVIDLAPLAALISLETLNLRGTQIADVAPLVDLVALQTLSLWGTRVMDLTPLTALTSLKILNLR